MELDDLKIFWTNASNQPVTQKILTPENIDLMIKRKYYSKIRKIAYPEIAGTAICLTAVTYIGINFNKLDSSFLQGTGILTILLLIILSALSIASLQTLKLRENANRPYAEMLKIFIQKKSAFYKLQKINILLSYLLLVTTIILLSKLYTGTDISGNKYFWIFSFSLGYIFLLFFSTYVSKFYKKTLQQTEELLKEL